MYITHCWLTADADRALADRLPLLLMELAVGQYTRRGPIGALGKLCPILAGAGVGTVIISFLLSTYYNVILAWAMFYLLSSFQQDLPWTSCDNWSASLVSLQ